MQANNSKIFTNKTSEMKVHLIFLIHFQGFKIGL